MSGYRHSGMGRDDYEAREKLYDVAVFVEERWPGQYPTLCRDLRNLGDTVSEESAGPEPSKSWKPIPPGARWPSPWDYDPRGIDGGDPDTACGDAYRTEYQGVARCLRGQGHPSIHNGPAEDGTAFQWGAGPVRPDEEPT